MNQRAMLQEMDADIMAALMGAGMGDLATYVLAPASPIECEVMVDRAAQFFDDATDIVGKRVVIGIFLAQVPQPQRGATITLADGEQFRLDIKVHEDESLQRWVVTNG